MSLSEGKCQDDQGDRKPRGRETVALLVLFLVPKLCLGTRVSKLRFETWFSVAGLCEAGLTQASYSRRREAELRDLRSQAELGNEGKPPSRKEEISSLGLG